MHGTPPPPPRQFPPAPRTFINRAEIIAEVQSRFREGVPFGISIVALSGGPGIGKTTLGSVLLRSLSEDLPDGQLYADLRGHADGGSAGPTVREVLSRWLRAYGIGPVLPTDLDELSALWRSATAGRVGVLIDNPPDADEVHRLLPGGEGSLVVVTSRMPLFPLSPLVRHGALLRELGPLPPHDARALLAHYASQLPEPEAARLAAAGAGSPLALSLLGPLAASHPTRTTTPSARHNSTTPEEIAMTAAMDDVYKHLSEPVQIVYRRVGTLPVSGDFDLDMVAAVCALPEPEAARRVDLLAEANVVQPLGADGRFRFHDAVREHAARQAELRDPAPVREEALRRLVDWCLAGATAAEELLVPSHRDAGLPRTYEYPPAALPAFTRAEGEDAQQGALAWLAEHREVFAAATAPDGADGAA